jgi:hypothetical protein
LTFEMVAVAPRSTFSHWLPVLLLIQEVEVLPSTALAGR